MKDSSIFVTRVLPDNLYLYVIETAHQVLIGAYVTKFRDKPSTSQVPVLISRRKFLITVHITFCFRLSVAILWVWPKTFNGILLNFAPCTG